MLKIANRLISLARTGSFPKTVEVKYLPSTHKVNTTVYVECVNPSGVKIYVAADKLKTAELLGLSVRRLKP